MAVFSSPGVPHAIESFILSSVYASTFGNSSVASELACAIRRRRQNMYDMNIMRMPRAKEPITAPAMAAVLIALLFV